MPYPRIIAHRGGGAMAPENTLAGLRLAQRIGVRGVEFDVMLSADGVPLLIHDETLDRTTTGHGQVCHQSAGAIRLFDAGVNHHASYEHEVVPNLSEAMECCSALNLWCNIEIKPANGYEIVTGERVAQELSTRWDRRGVVSSFSLPSLHAVRRVDSTLPIALLFESLPCDWQATAAALGASAIHLDGGNITPQSANALTGWRWACYTVNRRDEADRLFALGCSAVFTDRPDLWMPSEF